MLERITPVGGPAVVTATAAITLLGSAAIVPSFANTQPAAQFGSTVADTVSQVARRDGVPQSDVQRQFSLRRVSAQVQTARRDALLQAHYSSTRKVASAIKAESNRLRNVGTFLWPTKGGVSSGFGWRVHPVLRYRKFHNGADIGGACNNPIFAAQSGRVIKTQAGFSGGSGNNVRIDHGPLEGDNIQTAYLHMSRFNVKAGQYVEKGDVIGSVGSTGLSTACHLHLSLYKNGAGSDPLKYVKK